MSFPVRAGMPNHMQRAPYIPSMVPMPMMTMQGVYRGPLLPQPQLPPATIVGAPVPSGAVPPAAKKATDVAEGPPVTVFVGNITSRAPDAMVRYILTACGPVVNWKRVSSFGFCEFSSPEAGLRCVRLLHDRDVGGKRLVAKVDAKTTTLLDQYKNDQRAKMGAPASTDPDTDDYLDVQQKALDASTLERIQQLIAEYQDDMNNYEANQLEEQIEKRNRILQEADIEEEKRDVIHREIGKFREIMKVISHSRDVNMNVI